MLIEIGSKRIKIINKMSLQMLNGLGDTNKKKTKILLSFYLFSCYRAGVSLFMEVSRGRESHGKSRSVCLCVVRPAWAVSSWFLEASLKGEWNELSRASTALEPRKAPRN